MPKVTEKVTSTISIENNGRLDKPLDAYAWVPLIKLIGCRVAGIGYSTVDGPCGEEPCTIIFTEDYKYHIFVHPADNE